MDTPKNIKKSFRNIALFSPPKKRCAKTHCFHKTGPFKSPNLFRSEESVPIFQLNSTQATSWYGRGVRSSHFQPGDSSRELLVVGGHQQPSEKGHLTIPKRALWITCLLFFVPFFVGFVGDFLGIRSHGIHHRTKKVFRPHKHSTPDFFWDFVGCFIKPTTPPITYLGLLRGSIFCYGQESKVGGEGGRRVIEDILFRDELHGSASLAG